MKIIIIGGVAAGSSAAAKLSRLKKDWDITIYEESDYISYSACNMPYAIGNWLEDEDSIAPRDPLYFKENYGVKVQIGHRVEKIDPKSKTIRVQDLKTGKSFEDSYDKLLLATGARSSLPPIPGRDQANVFSLRQVEDMLSIQDRLACCMPKGSTICIVGAGFIGLEMVENFVKLGYKVKLLASSKLSNLSPEMSPYLEEELLLHGVEIIKGSRAKAIQGRDLTLEDGRKIQGDFFLMATGVRPNIDLAQDIGVEIGEFKAIITNDQMQTNIPHIYAAGDVVQTRSLVDGSWTYVPLGSTANKMGRVVADNMAGRPTKFPGIMGSSIFKLFDLEVGSTGLSEKTAQDHGFDTLVFYHIHRSHYASHGGQPILIKAVLDRKSQELLGVEAIGFSSVKNRIDVYASFMTFHGKIQDLEFLDLAYAPPFSTVRDVVLYTGMIGSNLLDKDAPSESHQVNQDFMNYIKNLPRP